MRSDRIKTLEKSTLWIFLISVVIVSALYCILLENKYIEYSNKVTSYIKEREYELADSILEKKNMKSTENAFKVLPSFNVSAYIVSDSDKVVFKWPEEANRILSQCENKVFYPLTRGLPVGTVKTCLSRSKIARSTFTTESFISTVFLMIGSLGILSFFVLISYRKSLEKSVDKTLKELMAWNRDSNRELSVSSDDRLTSKILNFVKQGYESRIELTKVRSEFEKEKEINKVIRQVAHDIRDPIRSVTANLRLIGDELDDNMTKVINFSLERIEETFGEILSVKRGKKSKLKVADVGSILSTLFKDKQELYSDINFQLETPEQASAICSPAEFKRVVSNVLNNSIESLDKKDKDIVCKVVQKNESIAVTFTDNGKGIASEHLDEVFDENFTAGKDNGNGLGLFYVSSKVREWDGKVSIHSHLGKGTELRMELASPSN